MSKTDREDRKSEEIVMRKKIPTKKYHRTTTAKDIHVNERERENHVLHIVALCIRTQCEVFSDMRCFEM